jgi:hypothetical protein
MDGGGRARTPGDGDLRGWTWVDVLPPDGMQEVTSSNLLSSTGQKHNSNRSNGQYSSKVPQRRPDGPPYVCSDRYLPLAGCWQDPRISVTVLLPLRRATWANSSSPGALTFAGWVVTRLVRAVSRAVTVAVFAGGLHAAGSGHPRSTPGTRAGHTEPPRSVRRLLGSHGR